MTDTVSPGSRLRCSWEVHAGIIPGQPMPEFTRRWLLTSETFYAEEATGETFLRYRDEAYEYAKSLSNPAGLNWVRVEWCYL